MMASPILLGRGRVRAGVWGCLLHEARDLQKSEQLRETWSGVEGHGIEAKFERRFMVQG